MGKQILLLTSSTSPLVHLELYYKNLGYNVLLLTHGIDVFDLLCRSCDLALVIMDESLSRSASLDIFKKFKVKSPNVKILYVEGRKDQHWFNFKCYPDVVLDPTFDCEQIIVHADYLLRQETGTLGS